MSYLVDRGRAFRDTEVVAVLGIRQRGLRSRLVLRDSSVTDTRTRARTFRQKLQEAHGHAIIQTV